MGARSALEGLYFTKETFDDGTNTVLPQKFTTVVSVETLDLLSEGEIQGLVEGNYSFVGSVGNVGYTSYTFNEFPALYVNMGIEGTSTIPTYVRSIYFNDIPIVNEEGQLNFANIDIVHTKGLPAGSDLTDLSTQYLAKLIGEQLRGCDIEAFKDGKLIEDEQLNIYYEPIGYPDTINDKNNHATKHAKDEKLIQPSKYANQVFIKGKDLQKLKPWPIQLKNYTSVYQPTFNDNIKIYKILNRECLGCFVNLKVTTLQEGIAQDDDEDRKKEIDAFFGSVELDQKYRKIGDIVNSTVYIGLSYRPLFETTSTTIDPRSNWLDAKIVTLTGRTINGIVVPTKLDFQNEYPQFDDLFDDDDFIGWEVLVFRITKDSVNSHIRNSVVVDSISEMYGTRFTYPYAALVKSKFSSEYFQQIPERAFRVRLLKVKVPSNYNVILRTYDESGGPWDGTFKDDKEWSNNPAWCYYDLLTNPRYGLGKYIGEDFIDKWTLYEIAKYCDTLVDDGYGGVEPRFTFNWWFTTREEAYKVLADLTSVFRAMIYYGFGTIYTIQDAPKEAVYTFTNANVEEGQFNYSSSSKKERYTVAVIRYNDPNNMFRPAYEHIEDVDGIRKYGIRETNATAFGCSSRGQAVRLGKWLLLTNILETEILTFTAGHEGSILRPGDVISVFDINRKAHRYAGRTVSITESGGNTTVVLDSAVTGLISGRAYRFSILVPTYYYEPSTVTDLDFSNSAEIRRSPIQTFNITGASYNSATTSITFTGTINTSDYQLIQNMIWSLDITDDETYAEEDKNFIRDNVDFYRIIRISEKDDHKYEVGAVQYVEDKYDKIEEGIGFEVYIPEVQSIPPSPNASLVLQTTEENKINNVTITAGITGGYSDATSIEVYMKADSNFDDNSVPHRDYKVGKFFGVGAVNVAKLIPQDNNKDYFIRVYTKNDKYGTYSSTPATGKISYVGGFDVTKMNISSLQIQQDYTGFSGKGLMTSEYNPVFTWQVGGLYGPDLVNAERAYSCRVTIRPPQYAYSGSVARSGLYWEQTGIKSTNGYFSYQFPFALNSIVPQGPHKHYDIVVEAHDVNGNTSAGGNISNQSGTFYTGFHQFDVATFLKPIDSGIQLSNNIITYEFSGQATGVDLSSGINFQTEQFLGPNGEVVINFLSGTLSPDLRGCFIYVSSGAFPKREAAAACSTGSVIPATGNIFVYRYQFKDLDVNTPTIYHPYAGRMIRGYPTGFISLAFYDAFDEVKLERTNDREATITGLFMSNNAIITNRPYVGSVNISEKATFKDFRNSSPYNDMMVVNYGTPANPIYRLVTIDASGNHVVVMSNI